MAAFAKPLLPVSIFNLAGGKLNLSKMAETKKITSLYVVTDSENSYEHIGDIDGGGIEKEWLKNHIKNTVRMVFSKPLRG